jgi:hypothetical protein
MPANARRAQEFSRRPRPARAPRRRAAFTRRARETAREILLEIYTSFAETLIVQG